MKKLLVLSLFLVVGLVQAATDKVIPGRGKVSVICREEFVFEDIPAAANHPGICESRGYEYVKAVPTDGRFVPTGSVHPMTGIRLGEVTLQHLVDVHCKHDIIIPDQQAGTNLAAVCPAGYEYVRAIVQPKPKL